MVIMRTIYVCQKRTNQIAITMTTWTETGKWAEGFARQKTQRHAAAYLAMTVALTADTMQLSACSREYFAFLTMCRTVGFALKLNIAHDYAMPALQTDIDRDLNTLHHCLGAA